MNNYNGEAPFEGSSETSQAAAMSMRDTRKSLAQQILTELHLPRTCDDIEVLLSMSHQTASARIRELYLDGLIVKAGKRKTRSGRAAVLWQDKDKFYQVN